MSRYRTKCAPVETMGNIWYFDGFVSNNACFIIGVNVSIWQLGDFIRCVKWMTHVFGIL